MASTAAMASSISSVASRRLHYQSQSSNQAGQETSNMNESFSLSNISVNPLITIVYTKTSPENQQLLLNSYASCRRLLDHTKQVAGLSQDETIDLMDNEGKIKELNTHFDDYATQFLTARSTYYVLKVEIDSTSGEKRYTPNFNIDQIDQKLNSILTNSLNTLNKSNKTPVKRVITVRQNTITQSSSHPSQSKAKRTSARKQN